MIRSLCSISILVLLLVGGKVSTHWFALEIFGSAQSRADLGRAIDWDSSNPEFFFRRSLLTLENPGVAALDSAGRDLRTAIALNRHNWRYQTALGRYHELAGAWQAAENAYLKTVQLSPSSGFHRWNLANFQLRRGDTEAALFGIKTAIELDPSYREAAADLLLKMSLTWKQLEQIWPGDPESALILLRIAVLRSREAPDQIDSDILARQWTTAVSGRDPIAVASVDSYLSHLLQKKQYHQLRRSWIELMKTSQNTSSRFERKETYLWNGALEMPLTKGFLDWIPQERDVQIEHRAGYGKGGTGGIQICLKGGEDPNQILLSQRLLVDCSGPYTLLFQARTEALTGGGVFLEIVNAQDGGVLFETAPMRGTTPWTRYAGSFLVPSGSQTLSLRVRRRIGKGPGTETGFLWLDNVDLTSTAESSKSVVCPML